MGGSSFVGRLSVASGTEVAFLNAASVIRPLCDVSASQLVIACIVLTVSDCMIYLRKAQMPRKIFSNGHNQQPQAHHTHSHFTV
jgi:hypothetical protein